MTLADHHEWIRSAANQILCGGDVLWQAMCSEWAEMAPDNLTREITDGIADALA
jgi:hypothetical protein